MKTPRVWLVALALVTPLVAAADIPPPQPPPAKADRAATIARAVWDELGGDAGWNRARYFRFDFIVEKGDKLVVRRAHYWDRFTGRYRVDGTGPNGPYSVWFDVNTRRGDAFVGGKRVTDAAQAKAAVEKGYGAFINDTYWLLAPYKLRDPGVHLELAGAEGDRDILKLTFDNVGLTPKDVYWLFVERSHHRVVGWKYVLDGGSGPPTEFSWSDWKQVGPILLASTRAHATEPTKIRFESLAVSEKPDEAALTPPATKQ
jgi:hypothetical protein